MICYVTRKPRGLKVRHYADHLIELNEYLDLLPGTKLTDKICMTEMNKIMLNSMPDSWIEQACMQGFDCGCITFKNLLSYLKAWRLMNLFKKRCSITFLYIKKLLGKMPTVLVTAD